MANMQGWLTQIVVESMLVVHEVNYLVDSQYNCWHARRLPLKLILFSNALSMYHTPSLQNQHTLYNKIFSNLYSLLSITFKIKCYSAKMNQKAPFVEKQTKLKFIHENMPISFIILFVLERKEDNIGDPLPKHILVVFPRSCSLILQIHIYIQFYDTRRGIYVGNKPSLCLILFS